MTRKLLAIILTVSMLLCMLSSCASPQKSTTISVQVDSQNLDIVVEETEKRRSASTTYEGVPMKCEHWLDTDEYWLYLEEEPIKLKVNTLDNEVIEVFTVDEWKESKDDVIGQFVLTTSLMVPGFITAAKILIGISIGVVVTQTIYLSANALGNVIGGIRYNTNTYYRYRQVDISAADAIRFGRLSKYNTCYNAYLSGNTVMIGQEITEWQAINRMKNGYDIFATSAYVAGRVANAAATYKGVFNSGSSHSAHRDGEYPHYHAFGRRWYKNRNHSPHAWYPF